MSRGPMWIPSEEIQEVQEGGGGGEGEKSESATYNLHLVCPIGETRFGMA